MYKTTAELELLADDSDAPGKEQLMGGSSCSATASLGVLEDHNDHNDNTDNGNGNGIELRKVK